MFDKLPSRANGQNGPDLALVLECWVLQLEEIDTGEICVRAYRVPKGNGLFLR